MRRLAVLAVVATLTGCWATGTRKADHATTLVIGAAILTGLVLSVATDHGDTAQQRLDDQRPAMPATP